MIKNEPKVCEDCGKRALKRDHLCEDYLVWKCTECGESNLWQFPEWSDADWKWAKKESRRNV